MDHTQTESSTPTEPIEKDTDFACFVKAKDKGEPTFTLRAQDVTAPVLVRAWAIIQIHVGIDIANGFTVEEAVRRVDDLIASALNLPNGVEAERLANMPKVEEAMVKAQDMHQWPNRKVAD